MLGRKLGRLVRETRLRKRLKNFFNLKKEKAMPMGKGTYGSQKGRPPKKKMGAGLTAKQKTLPKSLQAKIMKAKKK